MAGAQELRELTDDALAEHLARAREEVFNLRFSHATGQLDDTSALGDARRQVARLETLRREREIAAAEATNQE